EAQNESKKNAGQNMDFFTELYKDPVKLQEFMDAMSGIQMGNFMALVHKFDFNRYATLLDVGGADGWLCIQIAMKYQLIRCTTFDLPPVAPLAKKKIEDFRLADRVKVHSGDFMKDDLPKADVIVMGNILHGMNAEAKINMLKKIFDSLEDGGVFIAIENIIDKERKENTFGLLMSKNMLIENGDAFDYTMDDFEGWTKNIGYSSSIMKKLGIDPHGKSALEVGSGGGILTEEIRKMGFATTGIDPAEESVRTAANHAAANGLHITYDKGTGEHLPYPDDSFDCV